MKLRGLVVVFLLHVIPNCFAAGEFNVTGGRAAGMGFSSVALSDAWSAGNNPGGLGCTKSFAAGIYVENRFLVKELSLKAVTVTIPVWKGSFGLILQHMGFSLYNEIKGGVGYGMLFGKYFAAGIQLNCLRISQAEGYGNRNIFSFEIGAQYRASSHLALGVHLVNPVAIRISSNSQERIPALVRLGLLWNISDELLATVEAEKDLLHKPVIRAGVEYHLSKTIFARAGIATNPTLFTIGAGLEFGSFRLDLASGYHLVLGYSPQASVTYRFK